MKIERISQNKIRVTATGEDLLKHGLRFENFANDTPAVQNFFFDLMRQAEYEADFVIDEGQVLIEAMPLHSDGIVIFVTRPGAENESPRAKRIRCRTRMRSTHTDEAIEIFVFENFDDVCAFASQWRYAGERSTLYSLRDAYYLVLSFDRISYDKAYVDAQALEFARHATFDASYLDEHGKKICDGDAIASIVQHFGNR